MHVSALGDIIARIHVKPRIRSATVVPRPGEEGRRGARTERSLPGRTRRQPRPVLLTVVVADDPWKSELSVGIDGNKGVLHYSGEGTPPNGVDSENPAPSNSSPVIYYYVSADTEFPANAEIPFSTVEAAVVEYLTTEGEQPAAVDWQTTM
ncbi:Imm1 family immunity protein [Saccharomonospora azurea]